ncbi:hypothetical protein ElyMa_005324600 [Elysia marginata]|uniref:Cyclic nucleotide-binding domain-containing protein n=1 Tax=Elysia marginata TaxID=1093978 RepID=A0AAV4K073_9GAST|nr:hypothetical protein ElyMa_005324600 [Elysia marginata]
MKKLNKPDVQVFTDGSARDGVYFLGRGILVIEKEERHSLSIAAGRYGIYDCPEVDFFRSLIPGDPMESLWESPVEMIEFLRASQRLPIA